MRQRTIFVGVRNDLKLEPVHPKPLSYQYTVRDAWEGLEQSNDRNFAHTKLYQYWLECDHRGNHPKRLNLKRLRWLDPSNTVCQTMTESVGTAALAHPDIPRYPTIPELKRISAFPDDFTLIGTYSSQWERLGRAVPPVMMSHIAKTIQLQILEKL